MTWRGVVKGAWGGLVVMGLVVLSATSCWAVAVWLVAGTANAEEGLASWYAEEACQANPDPRCPTASGESLYELLRKEVPYAAMWGVPFGTTVHVCRADRGQPCVVARIEDRGPARRLGRLIDLSPRLFERLAPLQRGVIRVTVKP